MSLDELIAKPSGERSSSTGGAVRRERSSKKARAAPYARSTRPAARGPAGAPGSRVYVGNLHYHTSWQDLKDHFRSVGDVLNADVMMGADGRSKGCGIVTFASAKDAQDAIETLHDSELNGRKMFVREDREDARPGGGGGGGGGQTRVYVGNLHYHTSWQDLKDHFRAAGDVVSADVMMGGDGRSKGCGLVTFANARGARKAIDTLHDTELEGRLIFVREDRESETSRAPARGGGGQCKVFVGNLPHETTWQELKDIFRKAGDVVRADIPTDASGRSKGHGLVTFGTARDAAKAIQLFHECDLGGRTVEVRPDTHG